MVSHRYTTMSIHMWSTECSANRQPSDGRCSNILNRAWNYCHAIFRTLDQWSPQRPNIHITQRSVLYSRLRRSPVNSGQMGYANLLLHKCLWWIFPNGCNAFNCEHPQMCFGCTCLIYINYTWPDKGWLIFTTFNFHEITYIDISYTFISPSVCTLNILGLNNHQG